MALVLQPRSQPDLMWDSKQWWQPCPRFPGHEALEGHAIGDRHAYGVFRRCWIPAGPAAFCNIWRRTIPPLGPPSALHGTV